MGISRQLHYTSQCGIHIDTFKYHNIILQRLNMMATRVYQTIASYIIVWTIQYIYKHVQFCGVSAPIDILVSLFFPKPQTMKWNLQSVETGSEWNEYQCVTDGCEVSDPKTIKHPKGRISWIEKVGTVSEWNGYQCVTDGWAPSVRWVINLPILLLSYKCLCFLHWQAGPGYWWNQFQVLCQDFSYVIVKLPFLWYRSC